MVRCFLHGNGQQSLKAPPLSLLHRLPPSQAPSGSTPTSAAMPTASRWRATSPAVVKPAWSPSWHRRCGGFFSYLLPAGCHTHFFMVQQLEPRLINGVSVPSFCLVSSLRRLCVVFLSGAQLFGCRSPFFDFSVHNCCFEIPLYCRWQQRGSLGWQAELVHSLLITLISTYVSLRDVTTTFVSPVDSAAHSD